MPGYSTYPVFRGPCVDWFRGPCVEDSRFVSSLRIASPRCFSIRAAASLLKARIIVAKPETLELTTQTLPIHSPTFGLETYESLQDSRRV